jgi:hypothetical protein
MITSFLYLTANDSSGVGRSSSKTYPLIPLPAKTLAASNANNPNLYREPYAVAIPFSLAFVSFLNK